MKWKDMKERLKQEIFHFANASKNKIFLTALIVCLILDAFVAIIPNEVYYLMSFLAIFADQILNDDWDGDL